MRILNRSLSLLNLLSPVMAALCTGLYANIFTSKMLVGNFDWQDVIIQLGYDNLLLIGIGLPILIPIALRRKYKKSYEKIEKRLMDEFFRLVGHCICFPNECKNISIHYFGYRKKGGSEYLQKIRRYSFESESLPGNHPLEIADIHADNLVMCEAFKTKAAVYEELPQDHMNRYSERIKHLVDPAIRWVLACPVWLDRTDKSPNGVMVFFGSQPPIDRFDALQQNTFKHLIVQSSIIMSSVASLKEGFSWEES